MSSKEIIEKYIKFFEKRDHVKIPNVSLVPENDPTLLFVNSGMFPLVPYLFGEPHPLGTRLVNVQRCLRFEDIEEVGESNRHTVAFHMLGNWSLSDYFKKEQLAWIYEFYVDELGLDPKKLFASVFAGDDDAPKDEESIEILKEVFSKYGIEAKEGERIFTYSKGANWWQRGDAVGEPGGPDSETFYYIGEGDGVGLDPDTHQDKFIEIGNSVFLQYKKVADGWKELAQKNVDFGGGLERLALAVQGKHDIFETDNFWPIILKIEEISGKKYGEDESVTRAMRILADHMRAATFIAMDGVLPGNKDQGYILRRLLRKMARAGRALEISAKVEISVELVDVVVENFAWMYPQLETQKKNIEATFLKEELRFERILEKGALKVDKFLAGFGGTEQDLAEKAFEFYQSVGYPFEIFMEDAKDRGLKITFGRLEELYGELAKEHQSKSRTGAEQKFKGGLADQSEQVVKYHTTTHLLHWALRQVLGSGVMQQGSNITGERLRFDFSHGEKLHENEIDRVETLVNDKIAAGLTVNSETMPREEAEKMGALSFFKEKYEDKVKVYYIGENIETAFSKEFCGGPHVKNTSELDPIEIYKQGKIGENNVRVYVRAK